MRILPFVIYSFRGNTWDSLDYDFLSWKYDWELCFEMVTYGDYEYNFFDYRSSVIQEYVRLE